MERWSFDPGVDGVVALDSEAGQKLPDCLENDLEVSKKSSRFPPKNPPIMSF